MPESHVAQSLGAHLVGWLAPSAQAIPAAPSCDAQCRTWVPDPLTAGGIQRARPPSQPVAGPPSAYPSGLAEPSTISGLGSRASMCVLVLRKIQLVGCLWVV